MHPSVETNKRILCTFLGKFEQISRLQNASIPTRGKHFAEVRGGRKSGCNRGPGTVWVPDAQHQGAFVPGWG